MPLSIKDGGTWRTIQQAYVKDGVTWRPVQVWVNDGGTWRIISTRVIITDLLVNRTVLSPSSATATYTLRSNGTIETNGSFDSNWVDPVGQAGLFESRATILSGTFTGGTFGTWQALTSDRSWFITQSGVATKNSSMTLEIRRASDSVVVDTATISFQATVDL